MHYCYINKIDNHSFYEYLNLLPEFMRGEILRYKRNDDRKARLISKLLLLYNLKTENKSELIYNYKKDIYNKPYIPGWDHFNVSHSEQLVVFCKNKLRIGIDIEKKNNISPADFIAHFHIEEQNYIMNSKDLKDDFFYIWSRKESFFKAIGIGLTVDISMHNSLNKEIIYDGEKWNYEPIYIDNDYKCTICSLKKENEEIIEFDPNILFT